MVKPRKPARPAPMRVPKGKRPTVVGLEGLAEQVAGIADRMTHLEERLTGNGTAAAESRWQYLIARPHPWRRQLCIKGRNMTVGQLVSSLRANRMTPEQASENLDLPLAAICEALTYYAESRELIELEAAEERRRLGERGLALEPSHLPR